MLCQQRINARVVCTGRQQAMPAGLVRARVSRGSRVVVEARSNAFVQSSIVSRALAVANRGSRALRLVVSAVKDGAALDRPLRVAVIGGGPSGACAAETLAKGGVETFLLERKLDNCKVQQQQWNQGIPSMLLHATAAVFNWYCSELVWAAASTLVEARVAIMSQFVCGSDTLCCRSYTALLSSTVLHAAVVIPRSFNHTVAFSHSHQVFHKLFCIHPRQHTPCDCCPCSC
jgi:hypothetical protein